MAAINTTGDMVVRLYDLPNIDGDRLRLFDNGIIIRRALAPERHLVIDWMRNNFSQGWASECEVAFAGHPIHCHIATHDHHIVGVSVYDAIARGVAGPIGLHKDHRQQGLGKVLFIETLQAMAAHGYAYAIVGWTSTEVQGFYKKTVDAVPIDNSAPRSGMYRGILM